MSSCSTTAPEVQLQGLRIGYPRNWWKPTADEVSLESSPASDVLPGPSAEGSQQAPHEKLGKLDRSHSRRNCGEESAFTSWAVQEHL